MTNEENILADIERLNETHSMDFKQWMIWGITQIVLMTARILDNAEGRKDADGNL